MRYKTTLCGISGIIVHIGAAGLDTRSPAKLEISSIVKKRGSNRTESDDNRLIELECQNSLYLDDDGRPTLPAAALLAALEAAARKTKQGGDVREGLLVESLAFAYDSKRKRYNGGGDWEVGTVHRPGLRSAMARILRTRAKFDCPWSTHAVIDADDELAGQAEDDGMAGRGWAADLAVRLAPAEVGDVRSVRAEVGQGSQIAAWQGIAWPGLERTGMERCGVAGTSWPGGAGIGVVRDG